MNKPRYQRSVRSIIELVCRSGDLTGWGDFEGANRALQGVLGHQRWQKTREAPWQIETPVSHLLEREHFDLLVAGRMDAFYPDASLPVVEEIKTTYANANQGPALLHWAQAKLYAALCLETGLVQAPQVKTIITCYELDTGRGVSHEQIFFASELRQFFQDTVGELLDWVGNLHEWRRWRDASLRELVFPFARPRPGQAGAMAAVRLTIDRGDRLFLEAPTGVGKTISVLFPALKSLAEGPASKVYYLTARNSGAQAAEQAVGQLAQKGLALRVLTLTAREKLCPLTHPSEREGELGLRGEEPRSACDPANCPLTRGYYDRLKGALREACGIERAIAQKETKPTKEGDHGWTPINTDEKPLKQTEAREHGKLECDKRQAMSNEVNLTRRREDAKEANWNIPFLRALAAAHSVCPHALAFDLLPWADLVICDYNYAFDRGGALQTDPSEQEPSVWLVDEAHNLVDRGREIFSATLGESDVEALDQVLEDRGLARSLKRIRKSLRPPEAGLFQDDEQMLRVNLPGSQENGNALVSKSAPAELMACIKDFLRRAEQNLVQERNSGYRLALIEFYFQALRFLRTAEQLDENYAVIFREKSGVKFSRKEAQVALACLNPAKGLREASECAHATVFLSATLSPAEYFVSLLGGRLGSPADNLEKEEGRDQFLRIDSPFPPENLGLLVHAGIATTYQRRQHSFGAVVEAIEALMTAKAGNYLIYFPSFEYLEQVRERLQARALPIKIVSQTRQMSPAERAAFLQAFQAARGESMAAFAVLGGIFGEAIEFGANCLAGIVIVGVGLPQLSLDRELIRWRFDEIDQETRAGFDFAYTFPGMNRVLQAAGRMIRSAEDRGVLLLIDARYGRSTYRRLFPATWRPRFTGSTAEIARLAAEFWGDGNGG